MRGVRASRLGSAPEEQWTRKNEGGRHHSPLRVSFVEDKVLRCSHAQRPGTLAPCWSWSRRRRWGAGPDSRRSLMGLGAGAPRCRSYRVRWCLPREGKKLESEPAANSLLPRNACTGKATGGMRRGAKAYTPCLRRYDDPFESMA